MNTKIENELYNIAPVFFEHAINCKDEKETEMDTCMYFGCECGDGWFKPLKKFVQKTAYINKLAKAYNIKFVCDQLKEKYSQLTMYYTCKKIDENIKDDNGETIQENINILQEMFHEAYEKCIDECYNVCEICGADGGYNGKNLTTTHGWMSRICRNCAKQQAEKATKYYDESHEQEYVSRITWFHEGYNFLNLYDNMNGFNYLGTYYTSIIEAFYCIKDPKHALDFYKEISNANQGTKSSYLIEKLANEFGIKYEDNEEDYNLLKKLVLAKFDYEFNTSIKQELIETNGKLLQNMGKHHNNVLGHCICDECKDKEHKDLYAKILMEIRDQYLVNNNNN